VVALERLGGRRREQVAREAARAAQQLAAGPGQALLGGQQRPHHARQALAQLGRQGIWHALVLGPRRHPQQARAGVVQPAGGKAQQGLGAPQARSRAGGPHPHGGRLHLRAQDVQRLRARRLQDLMRALRAVEQALPGGGERLLRPLLRRLLRRQLPTGGGERRGKVLHALLRRRQAADRLEGGLQIHRSLLHQPARPQQLLAALAAGPLRHARYRLAAEEVEQRVARRAQAPCCGQPAVERLLARLLLARSRLQLSGELVQAVCDCQQRGRLPAASRVQLQFVGGWVGAAGVRGAGRREGCWGPAAPARAAHHHLRSLAGLAGVLDGRGKEGVDAATGPVRPLVAGVAHDQPVAVVVALVRAAHSAELVLCGRWWWWWWWWWWW
jgi:hypothetical protein